MVSRTLLEVQMSPISAVGAGVETVPSCTVPWVGFQVVPQLSSRPVFVLGCEGIGGRFASLRLEKERRREYKSPGAAFGGGALRRTHPCEGTRRRKEGGRPAIRADGEIPDFPRAGRVGYVVPVKARVSIAEHNIIE